MKTLEKFGTFKISDLRNNLSPEYHLNKEEGKKPYTKQGGYFIEVNIKKSIPKDAIYLTDIQVIKYNKITTEIKKLEQLQENILTNKYKKIY